MMNIKSYCVECRGDYSVDNNNENGWEKVGRNYIVIIETIMEKMSMMTKHVLIQ